MYKVGVILRKGTSKTAEKKPISCIFIYFKKRLIGLRLRYVALYCVGRYEGSPIRLGRPFCCFCTGNINNKTTYKYIAHILLFNVRKTNKGGIMKTLHTTQYTGRKAQVGSLCFDEQGRMCIFINYCEDCKGKVVLTRDEAEILSFKYKQITNKRQYKKLINDIKKLQLI